MRKVVDIILSIDASSHIRFLETCLFSLLYQLNKRIPGGVSEPYNVEQDEF